MTIYYKVSYHDGQFFIAKKYKGKPKDYIIIFSTVDKEFGNLQVGGIISNPIAHRYGFSRKRISENDARVEML